MHATALPLLRWLYDYDTAWFMPGHLEKSWNLSHTKFVPTSHTILLGRLYSLKKILHVLLGDMHWGLPPVLLLGTCSGNLCPPSPCAMWFICSSSSASFCSDVGIIIPFMSILSAITLASLKDLYGCTSFWTAFVPGQHKVCNLITCLYAHHLWLPVIFHLL